MIKLFVSGSARFSSISGRNRSGLLDESQHFFRNFSAQNYYMKILSAACLLMTMFMSAQDTSYPDFNAVDSLYREDQFYAGFTYNILQNMPESMSQNKFSAGLYIGFLRDMPINQNRTFAIAVGGGYALQNYNQDLSIGESAGSLQYQIIPDDIYYSKNKLTLHFVEVPVEIRWRTSTPESHKFWRVYTGLKFSYLVHSRSIYEGAPQDVVLTNLSDLNKFRYGIYVAAGYNTWNFHIYYGLNPIFKSAALGNGEKVGLNTLNVGLMFYIL